MRERIKAFIAERGEFSAMDSLEKLELYQALENEFGIHIDDQYLANIESEDDIVALADHVPA
jgi:acyl carrier protein